MPQPLVLVVEDDPMLRDLTRRQLTKLGYEAVLVGSGEEALDHDHSHIGLILMDIGLPGIDGAYATMLIREKELRNQRKRVPIVALTGHSDAQTAFSVGMDDFLQKPALMADLKRVLDKFLT
ncbi:MAG: response regulator [Candidatus Obscuribacterales bacterium]|nr:response regulator [Candidatus Obscuribacterales bacterium]